MLHNFILSVLLYFGILEKIHSVGPEKLQFPNVQQRISTQEDTVIQSPTTLNRASGKHKVASIEEIFIAFYPIREIFQDYLIESTTDICSSEDPSDWQVVGRIKSGLQRKYKLSPQAVTDYLNLINRMPDNFVDERKVLQEIEEEHCTNTSYSIGIS